VVSDLNVTMKDGKVGGVYFRLIRCLLTWVHLEEGLLNEFVG